MNEARVLLHEDRIAVMIRRIAYELYENHDDLKETAIIGLQPRGVIFARRVHTLLREISGVDSILFGELDVTFYRDDFRRKEEPLTPSTNSINFLIENKNVILMDDVLFTGRSIRAAMDALTAYGRPSKVELAVLIDRRYSRELPIEPDYTGATVDTRAYDKVRVEWKEKQEKDCVWLLTTEAEK